MHRIALLYGGSSSEREVSLRSGEAIALALQSIGHAVTKYDLRADSVDGIEFGKHSFAFIALHGGWGEGGGLQAELEARGIPFSGSDSVASALALDKVLTKAEFLNHRIPTPLHEVARRDDGRQRLRSLAARAGLPLVVKPATQGSSIGVSFVRKPEDADAALEAAFKWDERAVIEKAVVGRELTVAVIGARAYQPVEVGTSRTFYDYEAKYVAADTKYNPKPDLPSAVDSRARQLAKRAHNALRCHGYSRVDMMLDGDGELYVLEVNTLPGMTNRSLLPLATKQAGMSYEETLQAMIDASLCERRRISEDVRSESQRAKAA